MSSWQTFEAYNAHLNNGIAGMVCLLLLTTVTVYNLPRLNLSKFKLPQAKLYIPAPPLWITLIIALIMRLLWINQSLWYDETFTLNIVRQPFSGMREIILSDVHPAGGYLLIWLSTQIFGYSEIALRLPSLIFGLASIWLIYRIAIGLMIGTYHLEQWMYYLNIKNKDINIDPARWAALFVAIAPLHIYHSTEARAYAVLLFLFLLSLYALQWNTPAYILPAGLMAHMHAQGFIYLLFVSIAALYIYRGSRRWVIPLSIAWVIAMIYLPIAIMQSNDVSDGFWNGQFHIGDLLSYLFDTYFWRRYSVIEAIFIFSIALPYTFAALWVTRRWEESGFILFFWLGIPLFTGLVSALWSNIYLERTLMPAGLLIVFIWIRAAPRLPWIASSLLIAALVLATVSSLANWNRGTLRENVLYCQNADYVYTVNNAMAISMSAYLDTVVLNPTWREDLTQHLTPEAVNASGFILRDFYSLKGDICLIDQRSPLNNAGQTQHIKSILKSNKAYFSVRAIEYPHYIVDIYRIKL